MKRSLFLAGAAGLTLALGLVITGCGSKSPSDTVRQINMAILKGDAKTVGELMASKGKMDMEFIEGMANELANSKDSTEKREIIDHLSSITSTEETINGDKATVRVTYKDGSKENWDLVKVDGKWKVDRFGWIWL